jgi:hypothetical protein
MANRNVQAIRKENGGDTSFLYNFIESWSPRNTSDVILDIDSSVHTYYVFIAGKKVDIHVIDSPWGKYLRTDPAKTSENKLDDLPDC